jgi:thioredoxin-like negative regulator of GroEL
MHLILTYLLAAGAGVLIAHFISRAPELRAMRLSQLVLVPGVMVLCVYFLPDTTGTSEGAAVGQVICFAAMLLFLALLLAPNIAYHCGAALSNFLDPSDWTPLEEEIALRPIRQLIDKDQYYQALGELDQLLKNHPPTYEALLMKAKLLYHFGRVDETAAVLLSLIRLSKTTGQQLTVMELLAALEEHYQDPPKPAAAGIRRIEIEHELVLFPTAASAGAPHKEIPPGAYQVQETIHGDHRWLKLAGEPWGNARICWEAIQATDRPAAAPPKKGLFRQIARMHQAITTAIKGKPRLQRQAEAHNLLKQANQFIRRDEWQKALPLLQKASGCDPDHYEIAYRWVQAVGHTAGEAAAAQAVSQVLKQSRWTRDEQQMLHQLKHPLAK